MYSGGLGCPWYSVGREPFIRMLLVSGPIPIGKDKDARINLFNGLMFRLLAVAAWLYRIGRPYAKLLKFRVECAPSLPLATQVQ